MSSLDTNTINSSIDVEGTKSLDTRKSLKLFWVTLFVIYPFLATLLALRHYRSAFSKNVIWLFIIFFGFTFVITSPGMDANRYRDYFLDWATTSITFGNFFQMLYSEDTSYLDIAVPLINFILSRFTDNYKILFAVFGLIFGFFYSRNIWFLFDQSGPSIKWLNLVYILTFAFIIGYWEINGFRMWTAAHIFFYGVFQYAFQKRKNGLWIAASSIFVHFSFMFPVSILFIYILAGNRVSLFFGLYIVTMFFLEIEASVVRDLLTNILPDVFQSRVSGFTSEAYAEARSEDLQTRNLRFFLYQKSIGWSIALLITVMFFKGKSFFEKNPPLHSLFSFTLLFFAAANLISNIPGGGRFLIIGYIFAMACIFLYYQHAQLSTIEKIVRLITIPLLLFYCLGKFNISLITSNILLILGNPILAIFADINQTITEFFGLL